MFVQARNNAMLFSETQLCSLQGTCKRVKLTMFRSLSALKHNILTKASFGLSLCFRHLLNHRTGCGQHGAVIPEIWWLDNEVQGMQLQEKLLLIARAMF